MKIAKQISTGNWINDFQSRATAESLIANAEAMGIPENDVEVVDVTEAEFNTIVETETAQARADAEAAALLTDQELKAVGLAVRDKLQITTPQLKKFVQFMRQVDLDSF